MVWVMDLSGDQSWAREAVDALHAGGLGLQVVDAPVSESAVGVILSQAFSPELGDALGAVDPSNHAVVVIGPPDGTLDPWPVLASGASDCIPWRGQTSAISAWTQRSREVRRILESPTVRSQFVGTSKALTTALRDLIIAAHYGRAPVLILGETGTGKELAAKVAHAVSRQRGGLVVVDCTTIVPTLLGSELFGHERGAFTGAVSVRTGACSAADQGSLFLDEIGELPLDLQPELLRVIQEGAYKRVGGDRWLHSSFRLICATNRDLAGDVAGGGFRADLYHRIAATTVTMPPLRDRLEDVLGLFAGFCREASGASEAPDVDPSVQEALLHRDYPGNLRDLRQLASRVVARHVGPGAISPGDLPVQDRPVASPGGPAASPSEEPVLGDTFLTAAHCAVDQGWTLNNIEEEAKEAALQVALARCEGDKNAAARMLGVNVRTVQQRVKKKNDAGIPAQVSEESSSATSRQ